MAEKFPNPKKETNVPNETKHRESQTKGVHSALSRDAIKQQKWKIRTGWYRQQGKNQELTTRLLADFSTETAQKGVAGYIQTLKGKKPTT